MVNNHFSLKISVFHGYKTPEEVSLVGYGTLIKAFALLLPLPNRLTLIRIKNVNMKLIIGKCLLQVMNR